MAVEIQEPNDLPQNAITDDNAYRYEILVYEQSADVAGIKRLAIAGWKDYLQFNTHKVNNVANYLGIPSDYPWDSDTDVPYPGTTVTNQINALATKLGISQEPGTFDPLYPRFQTLENQVQESDTGLLDRMTSAEGDINDLDTRIDSLAEEIGGSGGSGSTLTGRIEALETSVGNTTSPESGLLADVTAITDKIGTDTITGSITNNISTLNTDVNTLKETVDGDGTNPGLTNRVTTLETTVGDSTDGLVKDVGDLQQQVSDIASNVYRFVGNITGVDDPDTTATITVDGVVMSLDSLKNGNVFNIEPQGTATTIIIQGITYDANENIVWVTPEGGTAHFDKLGPNIDVARIKAVEDRVDALETTVDGDGTTTGLTAKVAALETTVGDASSGLVKQVNSMLWTETADASWTSANIPNGIYQCSSVIQPPTAAPVLNSFIVSIRDGTMNVGQIDISGNFGDYWEMDGTGTLKIKSGTPTRTLSIHKIGEV